MLDLINIHKTFNPGTINEKEALDGVNHHLDQGQITWTMGISAPSSAATAPANPPP